MLKSIELNTLQISVLSEPYSGDKRSKFASQILIKLRNTLARKLTGSEAKWKMTQDSNPALDVYHDPQYQL